MNELCKKHSGLLYLAIASSAVSSLSLMAATLVNNEGKNKIPLIIFGVIFWIGLVCEQVFYWRSHKIAKEIARNSKKSLSERVSIFNFATYTEAIIADVIFVVSLIALVVCVLIGIGEAILQYILICCIVLTFRMHCILNGKSYRYKKTMERKVDRNNG